MSRWSRDRVVVTNLNKIETKVFNLLKSLDIECETNVQVGNYNVDFLINNKFIIECYGDFWHCNPAKYAPSYFNKGKKKIASDIWERDECRKNEFHAMGYRFLHLWESEINNNFKHTRKRVKTFLGEILN